MIDSVQRAAEDAGLRGELRFWLVQNISTMIHKPEMMAHAEDAVAALESVLAPAEP